MMSTRMTGTNTKWVTLRLQLSPFTAALRCWLYVCVLLDYRQWDWCWPEVKSNIIYLLQSFMLSLAIPDTSHPHYSKNTVMTKCQSSVSKESGSSNKKRWVHTGLVCTMGVPTSSQQGRCGLYSLGRTRMCHPLIRTFVCALMMWIPRSLTPMYTVVGERDVCKTHNIMSENTL